MSITAREHLNNIVTRLNQKVVFSTELAPGFPDHDARWISTCTIFLFDGPVTLWGSICTSKVDAQESVARIMAQYIENNDINMFKSVEAEVEPPQGSASSIIPPGFEFLETVSRDIPGPLRLTFLQVRNLAELACDLPYLSLQAFHLTQALQHLLVTASNAASSVVSIPSERLDAFLELQLVADDLEVLLEDLQTSFSDTPENSKKESLSEGQQRLNAFFRTICEERDGAEDIIRSRPACEDLETLDWRIVETLDNSLSDSGKSSTTLDIIRRNQRVAVCPNCGTSVSSKNLARHRHTAKCLDYVIPTSKSTVTEMQELRDSGMASHGIPSSRR